MNTNLSRNAPEVKNMSELFIQPKYPITYYTCKAFTLWYIQSLDIFNVLQYKILLANKGK